MTDGVPISWNRMAFAINALQFCGRARLDYGRAVFVRNNFQKSVLNFAVVPN
ncbi:hypothetical protein G9444_0418 [Rhodococcus erythropolis]|uniref:Uncharacterized protein n=1 Tax=Rhodococcus erythropolis TaxID=1833 RepID=A0A6G9CKW0_RHOER|nr:hypothetical protein G9444_0418 [Rhodococcus erythropolis]